MMVSVMCTSLASFSVSTETSITLPGSTSPPFRRALTMLNSSSTTSARTCDRYMLPTSSELQSGSTSRQLLAHLQSRIFKNNTHILLRSHSISAMKSVKLPILAQRVNFKAKRQVTIPFKEQAFSANDYLKETERIVKVTFPDSTRIEYLGDQKWLSRLRPITFISVSATPSVEMRVTFEKGALYLHSNNLFLDFSGVPDNFAVADFSFSLSGTLRAVARSSATKQARHNCDFAGCVSLGLSTDLPLAFALIPENIVTRVGDEILDRIIGAMEGALLQGIIKDYNTWCRLKSRKKPVNPSQPAVPVRTTTS